jgi:ABC-2 type transport system ATP-binding protein
MVAIALLGHPRAIILDEPTTGLDPHSRRDVWELIQRCQRQGAAVLLTTHYMEEAEFLSERIGIVSFGRLVALGTLDELHEHVNHRFRLTYHVPNSGYPPERATLYGRTMEELRTRITEMRLEEYDISKTNLEDIYLELTRRPLREEGNAAVA